MHNIRRVLPFAGPVIALGINGYGVKQTYNDLSSVPKSSTTRLVEKEMRPFLEEIGLGSRVSIHEKEGENAAFGMKSLKGSPLYILTDGDLRNIDPDAHAFVMGHEAGHLYNNDILSGIGVSTATGFSTAGLVNKLVRRVTRFRSPLAFLGAFIPLCVASWVNKIFTFWYEGRADDFAIEHSSFEQKLGGRRYFMAWQKANLLLKEEARDGRLDTIVSSEGNNLNDTTHPTFTSRVSKIESSLDPLLVKKVDEEKEQKKIDILTRYIYGTTKHRMSFWSSGRRIFEGGESSYKEWVDVNNNRVIRHTDIVYDVFGNEVQNKRRWCHEQASDDLVRITTIEYDDHGREIGRKNQVDLVGDEEGVKGRHFFSSLYL